MHSHSLGQKDYSYLLPGQGFEMHLKYSKAEQPIHILEVWKLYFCIEEIIWLNIKATLPEISNTMNRNDKYYCLKFSTITNRSFYWNDI